MHGPTCTFWANFATCIFWANLTAFSLQYFSWGVGTAADGSSLDIVPLTSVGLSVRARSAGLRLVCGSVYYAKVVCLDNAGAETHQVTDGITIDCTPPVALEPSDILSAPSRGG